MNLIYLFLTAILSFSVFSEELKCSKNGTAIVFINGVKNDEGAAELNFLETRRIAKQNASFIDSPDGLIIPDFQYNRSEGLGLDLIESGAQKFRALLPNSINPYKEWSRYLRLGTLSTSITNEQLKTTLKSQLNALLVSTGSLSPVAQDVISLSQLIGGYLTANRKTILVSHSQGNLLANEAYQVLQSSGVQDKLKYYKNLMVASVANSNASQGPWISGQFDVMVTLTPFTLTPNYEASDLIEFFNFLSADLPLMHGFLEIYTNPSLQGLYDDNDTTIPYVQSGSMEQIFTGNLIETAKLLESNCGCGDSTLGCTPENSHRYINPDDSEGGLIGNCVVVQNTELWIDPEAELCGESQLLPSWGSILPGLVKILNKSKVTGRTYIYSSTVTPVIVQDNAYVSGASINLPNPSNFIGIERGTKIEGNARVEGTFYVSDSVIGGNAYLHSTPNSLQAIYITRSLIRGSAELSEPTNGIQIEDSIIEGAAQVRSSAIFYSWIKDSANIYAPHGYLEYVCMNGVSTIESGEGDSPFFSNVIINDSSFFGNNFFIGGFTNGGSFTNLYFDNSAAPLSACATTERESILDANLLPFHSL